MPYGEQRNKQYINRFAQIQWRLKCLRFDEMHRKRGRKAKQSNELET